MKQTRSLSEFRRPSEFPDFTLYPSHAVYDIITILFLRWYNVCIVCYDKQVVAFSTCFTRKLLAFRKLAIHEELFSLFAQTIYIINVQNIYSRH